MQIRLSREFLEQNFQWSPKGIANALAAWIALMALKAEIGVMFAVWMLGRKLMAAVLCFGPWLLLTELFDETRGFCKAWVGKIVGLLVFQLASGAAMRIALDGQFYLLTTALDYANLSNVDQAIGTLFQVFAFIISDVFWIIALPAVCAIGSGAAAGHAVATSAIFGAAGGAASAGFQGFRGAFSGSRVARWGRNAIGRGE